MPQHQQQTLFRTTKERESTVNRIDRQNRQAATIILEKRPGGLQEEWARRVLGQKPSRETSGPC